MSDEQDSTDPKVRPRKVAKSASTAARPSFETPPASGEGAAADPSTAASGEGAATPPSGRKWDLRAERPAGEEPRRPRRAFPADAPRHRPGASGGRAMPDMPQRGPVDRASPDFVDRWLTQPQRKPEDRPPFNRGPRPDGGERRPDGPRGDGPRGDGPRGERPRRGADARPMAPPAKRPVAPPPAAKMPSLHETILVGLPKVALEAQRDKSAQKPKTAREALAAKAAASGKKKPESEAKTNEVVLDPSWLSVGADKAVATLAGAGPAAESLVDAWIQANNHAAIIETAHSEALSGASRKAARRALGVLKSRGVAIPERAVGPAVRAEEEVVVEATFSPPDARGTISVTITRRRGTERAHIAEVIVRDGVGVVNAVSGWMSRSQIKEAHQRITDATGVAPATVSPDWVRWRVAQALKDNPKSGQLVPISIDKCKELLEPIPAAEPAHPVSDLESALDGAIEASAALHAEPELRSWVADARALDDLLRAVGARVSQDDSKDASKIDAILGEEIKAATTRFYDQKERATLARRLRDAAIAVRNRVGDDRARDVLRAARAVESTPDAGEVEFLRGFLQKGIASMAHQSGGQLRIPR